MSVDTWVFLQQSKKPSNARLGDTLLVHHTRDLLVLHWCRDFSDLADTEETAEELWVTLGAELLRQQRAERGVLLAPAASTPVVAQDYKSAVKAYGPHGIWVKNIAREPGGVLVAGDDAEIPLPRFPNSRRVEFYVVKAARALRELELSGEPLRTVRLELRTTATPREVSAFYLPLLKAHGLAVKRRIWPSGTAELLIGRTAATEAFVQAAKHGATRTSIQITWVQLA